MKIVIQRVAGASVTINGGEKRTIGRGMVVFVGVGRNDTEREARWLADKVCGLRIFPDEKNRFDRASVNLVKNALFARHGHAFQNPRLARYYNQFDWYKKLKKKSVALADLPPDEQEMVTVLEKLEKSLPEK